MLIKDINVVNSDGVIPHTDILVQNGRIVQMGKNLQAGGTVIHVGGLYAFPGFCDMHSHLRDPGLTHKEDITSGTRSAAAGGFTAICCMPNTQPVIDNEKTVRYIIEKAKIEGYAKVYPVASITQGMEGSTLTDFAVLKEVGAIAFSDDGLPVEKDEMILAAMERAKELGVLLMLHEEDLANRGVGVANEGEAAKRAGLTGIPSAIEEKMTKRDIAYAQELGVPIHICHVSTVGSVELVRQAKKMGVRVTCETGPHYFSLTDGAVVERNANAKVNPPLRSEIDRLAVIEGICDGTIDVIATDHAPHCESEKDMSFENAPFGLIGFETAFPLAITNLYRKNIISLPDIARLMSVTPNKLLGLDGGRLEEGKIADITICDISTKYRYRKENIVSKAKNSPFIGKDLCGQIVYTVCEGRVTYDRQAN